MNNIELHLALNFILEECPNKFVRWTGAMMLYVVEILPYSMRAKGISLFWLITGAAGAFNTYVNPIGFNAFGKYLQTFILAPSP
jgi:hypothetical protein